MQRILSRNRNYLLFVLTVISLGILVGILYYQFLNNNTQEMVLNTISNFNNVHYNAILKYLTIMSLLLISAFFVIGIPFSIFYLFYESLSFGFLINIFYLAFKLKGLIYILIYLIINKLIVLFLLIIFIKKCIRIGRLIIGWFIYRKDSTIKEKIITNFKSNLYIIFYVFIINVILYFLNPYIFQALKFLLR